jgi:intracellular septation protein A
MQQILDFAPLVVFLVAYYLKDLYFATGALMLAMLGMLAADWLLLKRVPTMHWISAALVFAFGTATLLLHDQRFIQWKPTVFFWLVSTALLAVTDRLLSACSALRSAPKHACRTSRGSGSTCCGWRSTQSSAS